MLNISFDDFYLVSNISSAFELLSLSSLLLKAREQKDAKGSCYDYSLPTQQPLLEFLLPHASSGMVENIARPCTCAVGDPRPSLTALFSVFEYNVLARTEIPS